MGIAVKFSADDLKRSEVIDPDWYRVHINSVTAKPSKDQGSINYLVDGTILFNASNGDKKYANYKTPRWSFNSKAMGFTQGYFKALNGGQALAADQEYDLEYGVGKEIDVMIENGEYNGALQSQINNKYRAPKA